MKKDALDTFREFSFKCQADHVAALKQELIKRCALPWTHRPDKEEMANDIGGPDYFVFARDRVDDVEAAALFLLPRETDVYVANIIPQESGDLGISKYNLILLDFVDRIGKPTAEACGIETELSSGQARSTTWMSVAASKQLESFSVLANKSTGAAHPSDQQRWREFLIKVHKERSLLRADQLRRILIEQQDWTEDRAMELAIEFEFAMELLSDYDQLS